MNDQQLIEVYDNLRNILKRKKADDETTPLVLNAIETRNEKICLASFCAIVAELYEDLHDFDAAQLLFEEADRRNRIDQSLDDEDYTKFLQDLENIKNPGYRRFVLYLSNNGSTTMYEKRDDLQKIIQEGYENANVWGLLGTCHIDLGEIGKGEHAYSRSLQIDDQTHELLPKYREFMEVFFKDRDKFMQEETLE